MEIWYNMAVTFSAVTGTTNIISVPFTGSALSNITCMCWFYLNGTTPVNWRDIIMVDPNIEMQIFSDGISMDYGTATTDHVGSVLQANTWYHAAQVVVPTSTTNRNMKGYLNGNLNVDVTDTATFSTYTTTSVGNSTFLSYNFPLNGSVRDVRIWTRALDATEVVEEMNSAIPVNKPGLLNWAPFDDNSTRDKSGNNNVWTPGSAVTIQQGPLRPFTARQRSTLY